MRQVNYNFSYAINTRSVQKKVAEEKAKEIKGEEKGESPKSVTVNPEAVVGNGLDVLAEQNKALQRLAKPEEINNCQRSFSSDYNDYLAAVSEYESTQWETLMGGTNTEQIAALRQLINRLVNITNTHTELLLRPEYQQVSEDIINDCNRWNQEIDNLISSVPGGVLPSDPNNNSQYSIQHFCQSLEEQHNSLNAEFVFGTLSGTQRVDYFRSKVEEYQQVINSLEAYIQSGHLYPPEFIQLKQKFEQSLAEAQRYLQLSLNAIGVIPASEIEESIVNIGLNPSVK